jgi:hypothetical protein
MTTGLDYAWTRPTVDTLIAAGAHWVARYLSGDTAKNLSGPEYRRLVAGALPVVVVWESAANRAGAGFTAGTADARAALQLADAIGLGPDSVIHFAVDYDALWSEVAAYFSGISLVLPRQRTGVYGGLHVIESAAAAGYTYLWQASAWSGGQWSPHATIRQAGTTLGGTADLNQSMAPDFGQHPRVTGDTVTPEQIQTIIDGVIAGITSVGPRNSLALADLWWLEHAVAGTTTPGMTPAQAALVMSLHQDIKALNASPKP